MEDCGQRSQTSRVGMPAPSTEELCEVGPGYNLSKLRIFRLKNGASNNTCLTTSVWRLKELIFVKCLAGECLAHVRAREAFWKLEGKRSSCAHGGKAVRAA